MSVIDPDTLNTACMVTPCNITLGMTPGNDYYAIISDVDQKIFFKAEIEEAKKAKVLSTWELVVLALMGTVLLLLFIWTAVMTILYKRTPQGKGYGDMVLDQEPEIQTEEPLVIDED